MLPSRVIGHPCILVRCPVIGVAQFLTVCRSQIRAEMLGASASFASQGRAKQASLSQAEASTHRLTAIIYTQRSGACCSPHGSCRSRRSGLGRPAPTRLLIVVAGSPDHARRVHRLRVDRGHAPIMLVEEVLRTPVANAIHRVTSAPAAPTGSHAPGPASRSPPCAPTGPRTSSSSARGLLVPWRPKPSRRRVGA